MIISCINIKGGVGKTTSAIALATAAARDGYQAVVLDADPQASSTLWADEAADIGDPLPFEVRPANIGTIKRLKAAENEVIVIDCPPSGNVVDEAAAAADFVVVPSSPRSADMVKTRETVESLDHEGCAFAVLLTSVRAGTLAAKAALAELDGDEIPRFVAAIPLREDMGAFFGNAFGGELFGYEDVFQEIKEEIVDGCK